MMLPLLLLSMCVWVFSATGSFDYLYTGAYSLCKLRNEILQYSFSCHSVVIHILVYSIPSYVITEPESTLRVSIPNEVPLRPLMGDTLVLPCYFLDTTVNDPGAPTIAPLSHRIKWSLVTKEKITNILVASDGIVNIEKPYVDRITMLGYPMTPTDASIKITELHSNDSGVYRCEVMHGIEDSHDIVDVQVQGTAV